jgi:two-component system, NarL family, response regulator NreC
LSTQTTRIVLAEDHEVVRKGLVALLEKVPDHQIVGEASDGLEAVALVEKVLPNVLITDLMIPGLPGLEVVRRVAHRFPKVGVVVLSMHTSEAHVLEALHSGARAYVPKGASASELLKAIAEAAAGRRYLSPPLSHLAVEAYLRGSAPVLPDTYSQLTNREKEVLQLVAEGFKNSVVAQRLGISVRTVESHRANLATKLGLHGHVEIVRYALEHGRMSIDGAAGKTGDPAAPPDCVETFPRPPHK